MDAVGFALVAAVSFGALSVVIRQGLQRTRDVNAGTFVQNVIAFVALFGVALARSDVDGDVVPFLLVGLVSPGLAQLLYVRAISEAGPSRVSVLINASPLLAVALALGAFGEPFRPTLLVGMLMIVAGSAVLAAERRRPGHVRTVGLLLALAVAVCFAFRDNLLRHFAIDTAVGPELAAAVMLATASAMALLAMAVERRGSPVPRVRAALLPFAPAGVVLGIAYVCSYEAFFRGRVIVVTPLIGTASFWTVLFSVLALGRVEQVGRHVAGGALLVVAGAVLIGVLR